MENYREKLEKILSVVDKYGKFVGVVVLLLAFSILNVRPPFVKVLFSLILIACAAFSLYRKYKWRGVTIFALIVSLACLVSGCNAGRQDGYFSMKSHKAQTQDTSYTENEEADKAYADMETAIAEKAKADAEAEAAKAKAEAEKAKAEAEIAKAEAQKAMEEAGLLEETSEDGSKDDAKAGDSKDGDSKDSDSKDGDSKDGAAGVDPDLKAFLDEYEDFIDEYVDFMKKYQSDSNNVVLMMKEYGDMMIEYARMADKLDKYDEDEMSDADAMYYIEVTARCNKKLLEIK